MIKASVIIPVLNGGLLFQKVVRTVLQQKTAWDFELIVIDSGSVDGSVDFCRLQPDVHLYEITPEEYGHGRTRNYAASLARGEYLAFLTHDSLPTDSYWLQRLVDVFLLDKEIAGVFGRHIAYQGASPYIKRSLDNHFKKFNQQECIFQIEDYDRYVADKSYRQFLHFYSDNNSCMKKSVWEKIPYPDVDFAEDQMWAKKIIEAGYKKAYSHDAVVFHSHDYSVIEYFQRSFDEAMAFNQWFGYKNHSNLKSTIKHAFAVVKKDWKYLVNLKGYRQKIYWSLKQPMVTVASVFGSSLGSRYDTLPQFLVNHLSKDKSYNLKAQEKQKLKNRFGRFRKLAHKKGWYHAIKHTIKVNKQRWQPLNASTHISTNHLNQKKVIDFYRYTYKEQIEEVSSKYVLDNLDTNTINFFIPDFGIGSGGHLNIFRQMNVLEKAGYQCNVVITGQTKYQNVLEAKAIINAHFVELKANVFFGVSDAPSATFTFATSWQTAYYVRNFVRTVHKLYYVQDFEPFFYARGTEYYLAEETYRFGFIAITAGDWLASKLVNEYGMKAYPISFSVDKTLYNVTTTTKKIDNGKKHIFFYARPPTSRRMFEYGLLILKEVMNKVSNTTVVFAGWDLSDYKIDFPHISVGIQAVDALPDLYRSCDISLVFSATNLSLLPLELTACGTVVVSNNGDNVEWLLNNNFCELVTFEKEVIVDRITDLLLNPTRLEAKRKAGIEFVSGLPEWQDEYMKVVDVLESLLNQSQPR